MNRSTFYKIALTLCVIVLIVVSVFLVHNLFTSRVPGANDFLPRWKGTMLFFQEGINPYSTEATEQIQLHMYSRLANPDEDQVAFAYPFYTVLLLAPFAWFDLSYAMSSAVWLVIILVSIYAGLVGILSLTGLKAPPWFIILYFVCGILFYNSIRTLILGQFAGLIFLFIIGTLLALRHQQDIVAGILLALCTVKPQMALALIIVLLLWALIEKRHSFIVSFALSMGAFFIASFLLLPRWLYDFINHITNYVTYTEIGSPVWIVTRYYWPFLGERVELAASALIILLMLYLWYRLLRRNRSADTFLPLVMITLPLAELVVTRTATTNQIILYIPIMWVIARSLRYHVWRSAPIGFVMIVATVAGWALFLMTIEGDFENPIMFFFLPGIALSLLIWDRIVVEPTGRKLES